jgi:hypothetical protein
LFKVFRESRGFSKPILTRKWWQWDVEICRSCRNGCIWCRSV